MPGHTVDQGAVMASLTSVEAAQFSTAVRGYDRVAVDEAIAYEAERVRELQERADLLERELAVLGTAAGVPNRKQMLRQAVDVVCAGWDDAVRITNEAEHAIGRELAHAEGVAAGHLALAEAYAIDAERAAQAEVDRMVAAAKDEAARMLAEAEAERSRAQVGAAGMTLAAAERAKEIARGFTETLRSLEEDVVAELTERQTKAERELEVATAMLRRAEKDAAFAAEQAQAQRVAMLSEARAQVAEVEQSAGSQMGRLQQETSGATAELAELMIRAGGKLTAAKAPAVPGQGAAAADSATPTSAGRRLT